MRVLKLSILLVPVALTIVALPVAAIAQPIRFTCSGGKFFTALFMESRAKVTFDTRQSLMMRQVPAASGAQYKNANYVLSTKGKGAVITLGNSPVYQQCVSQ